MQRFHHVCLSALLPHPSRALRRVELEHSRGSRRRGTCVGVAVRRAAGCGGGAGSSSTLAGRACAAGARGAGRSLEEQQAGLTRLVAIAPRGGAPQRLAAGCGPIHWRSAPLGAAQQLLSRAPHELGPLLGRGRMYSERRPAASPLLSRERHRRRLALHRAPRPPLRQPHLALAAAAPVQIPATVAWAPLRHGD